MSRSELTKLTYVLYMCCTFRIQITNEKFGESVNGAKLLLVGIRVTATSMENLLHSSRLFALIQYDCVVQRDRRVFHIQHRQLMDLS